MEFVAATHARTCLALTNGNDSLFPGLPLWGGVLITSADVFLILLVYRPERGTRVFELFIACLVLVTLVCFIVIIARARPAWGLVFDGYLPSNAIVQGNALYLSVGILGATAMPHACYLCSHFSTMNRFAQTRRSDAQRSGSVSSAVDQQELADASTPPVNPRALLLSRVRECFPSKANSAAWTRRLFRVRKLDATHGDPTRVARMPLELVRAHLPFATTDIVVALVLFALTINSAILIVAGAALYYGANGGQENDSQTPGDLYDAFDLLKQYVGEGSALIFAIALLASAQAASVTVTLSGQIISEGFIQWSISPLLRRIITRLISLVPSLAVATAVGRGGLNELLVASQVTLSMALPFVLGPLFLMTGMRKVMKVVESRSEGPREERGQGAAAQDAPAAKGEGATAAAAAGEAGAGKKPLPRGGVVAVPALSTNSVGTSTFMLTRDGAEEEVEVEDEDEIGVLEEPAHASASAAASPAAVAARRRHAAGSSSGGGGGGSSASGWATPDLQASPEEEEKGKVEKDGKAVLLGSELDVLPQLSPGQAGSGSGSSASARLASASENIQSTSTSSSPHKRRAWSGRPRALLQWVRGVDAEQEALRRHAYFANGWLTAALAWAVFAVICIADVSFLLPGP